MKLEDLEKRLKDEPDNLGLRVTVAGLLRKAGRSVEAVELYRSVALAYRDQGRAQQAVAVCRSILEIAPEDSSCRALLAALQAQLPATPAVAAAPGGSPAGEPPSRPSLDETPLPRPLPHHVADPTVTRGELSPGKRPSFDETPLPQPLPHHVADPTGSQGRLSAPALEPPELPPPHDDQADDHAEDRPDTLTGLAQAARTISGLISEAHAEDVAAEQETRQRPRIDLDAAAARADEHMPETSPITRLDDRDILDEDAGDEDTTIPPRDFSVPPTRDSESDLVTGRVGALELPLPAPRPSDDDMTIPRRASFGRGRDEDSKP